MELSGMENSNNDVMKIFRFDDLQCKDNYLSSLNGTIVTGLFIAEFKF